MIEPIELEHQGIAATVTLDEGHPEHYLWIRLQGKTLYFLGVRVPQMTRGDVRRMAREFLEARATE